jgi:hypothetical protein
VHRLIVTFFDRPAALIKTGPLAQKVPDPILIPRSVVRYFTAP